MSDSHETFAADSPEKGAFVGCSCGWRRRLEDAPAEVPEGVARLHWLLDRKDEHRAQHEEQAVA